MRERGSSHSKSTTETAKNCTQGEGKMVKTNHTKAKKSQQEKAKKPEPSSSKPKSSPEKKHSQAEKDTMWSDAGFNESELTLSQLKNMITTLATEIFNKQKEAIKAEVDEEVEARLYDQSEEFEQLVDQLKDDLKTLKEENQSLKEENTKLKRRTDRLQFEISNKDIKIRELKMSTDAIEQQFYESDLQIVGIPEIPTEQSNSDSVESEIQSVVKLVQEKMNINLKPNDIENIHRMGKRKPDKTRDLVIRFKKISVRNKIYENRKKTAPHSDPKKNIYVNDKLTEYRRDILYAARQFVKRKKILAAWSQQGNILIRKTDKDHVIQVTCHEQLTEMFREPTHCATETEETEETESDYETD